MEFSPGLQEKIDVLKNRAKSLKLGNIEFSSPLLLAPMASICNAPFRLLMEELGAGGTVSELVSCHGINYDNQKTKNMLRILPEEKHVGLQLFGEEAEAMARASQEAQKYNPKFIDINMGCPVKKVVTKGGGSALLKDPKALGPYLKAIKSVLDIPLTIKIRTGWDEDSVNCKEIVNVAYNEGVEFVAVHGRTRAQKYTGLANWELLENLAQSSPLPIIGNGDLHRVDQVRKRMAETSCHALMLARGPLRNPFLFLEAYATPGEVEFTAKDYLEVIERYWFHLSHFFEREHVHLIQLRKHLIWFAAGFPGAAQFRSNLFEAKDANDILSMARDYFGNLDNKIKHIDYNQQFMTSGHG